MPKNRKRSESGVRLGPVFKAFVACLCIGLAGVGYVWQKNQLFALGNQMKKKEQRLAELELNNQERQRRLTHLRSPIYLENRIKALRLGLKAPHPGQVVTLPDAGRQQPSEAREIRMVNLRDPSAE